MFDIDVDIQEITYTETIKTDEYYGIIFMFDNIKELDDELWCKNSLGFTNTGTLYTRGEHEFYIYRRTN